MFDLSFARLVLSIAGRQEVNWRSAPVIVLRTIIHRGRIGAISLPADTFEYGRPLYPAGHARPTTHAHSSHRMLEEDLPAYPRPIAMALSFSGTHESSVNNIWTTLLRDAHASFDVSGDNHGAHRPDQRRIGDS